jgi:hypothetical protein
MRECRPSAEPDDAPREFWLTSSGVTQHAGLSYRQLDYWVSKGFLRPEVRWGDPEGKGHGRIWPPREVEIAARMARLLAAGLPLAWSAEFARDRWPCGELAPGITVTVTG